MIREIEIANYQSLKRLRVSLGRFTVVTGPSNTGKSAFIRAVELLAFNDRGVRYISRGQKTCTVAMSGDEIELTGLDDDHWKVVIYRGGRDAYDLEVPAQPGEDADGDFTKRSKFTKMAGKVPEQVSSQLRLTAVNFADQFDMPYLLDSTGSEVARVLGKLTNVTLLYLAAQEANRRRLASAASLKMREVDLAVMEQGLVSFATLPAEKAAVEQAEDALDKMQKLAGHRERLVQLTSILLTAQSVLDVTGRVPPEAPSLDRLVQLAAYKTRFRMLSAQYDDANLLLRSKKQQERNDIVLEAEARQALDRYTAQWGVCAVCGQPVKKEHSHA